MGTFKLAVMTILGDGRIRNQRLHWGPFNIWAVIFGDASPNVTQCPGLPIPGVWGWDAFGKVSKLPWTDKPLGRPIA